MSTRTLLTALCATALTLTLGAQTDAPTAAQAAPAKPAAAPAAPAAPATTVAGAEPTAAAVTRDKDTLSVDFPDEDIKTILRNVADLFELNLVVPDTLAGKTSIKLRDVTWRQIFQVVLAPVGYTYVEEGNIIKIVSNDLLQQEPGTTEVFILNNAKAADIKPTIDGLIDAATGGKIVIDSRSNALVITERPSRMGRIRTIIDQLDKATDQVMIESKFVEVTDRDIRNIGVNWASLQGMQFGAGSLSQTWQRSRGQDFSNGRNTTNGTTSATNNSTNNGTTTTNNNGSNTANTSGTNTSTSNGTTGSTANGTTSRSDLTSNTTYVTGVTPGTGFPSTINLANGTVSGLPTSVVTTTQQAGFVPATGTTPASATAFNTFTGSNTSGTTGSTNNGTNTSTSNGSNTSITNGTNTSNSTTISDAVANGVTNTVQNAVNALTGLTNTGGTSRLASAVFTASDFNVIVSALKTQNNTKIVSNPTIVTLNNTEASINIGQEFPVPSYTYNSERGSFEVSGFAYKPIGINLKVTPQVNARGLIKLTLEPEVSQQNGSTSFGGAGGASIPIVATRKVKTQVSLQNGETMGIGGLITNSQDHGGTKVPVLGSIPVLGRLFSSKNVNDTATNLLIFITAKTLSADGAAPEQVFDPRAVQAVGMSREDLPGNRAPKGTNLFVTPPATPAKK